MELLLQSIALSLILFIISISMRPSRSIECGGMSIASNITVDQHDKAALFQTIQSAIDSIKSPNDQWVKIHINAGTYMEKVQIPEDKPCVFLEGDDMSSTIVTYSDHNQTDTSATFTSIPSNVIVSGITFKNSYNLGASSKLSNMSKGIDEIKPASAARIYGDKSYFYKCGFWGFQDTLFDQMGRHYFKDCYIQGEVDFIFGYAQSIYENCWINATKGESSESAGYVTAHGRTSSTDPGGFVFVKGYLIGNGKVNLGRAWGPYSRVIFHRMYMSSVVTPQGWDAWDYKGHEENFSYAEINCVGEGANNPNRVNWVNKQNLREIISYYRSFFIDSKGWIFNLQKLMA